MELSSSDKGKSGEHLTTIPPYGYMKDPDNKKKWIIDEEAAAVVQQIFALCVSGLGTDANMPLVRERRSPQPYFLLAVKGYESRQLSRSRGQTRTSGRTKRFPVCLKRSSIWGIR